MSTSKTGNRYDEDFKRSLRFCNIKDILHLIGYLGLISRKRIHLINQDVLFVILISN